MAKVIIEFDTATTNAIIKIGKKKIDDFHAVFLHRDLLNSMKFTLQVFTQEGIANFKDGEIQIDNHQQLLLNKILGYFKMENNNE